MICLFAVNIRNLALEKVAEQVEFPCRFPGCTALMAAGDKAKHEKLCDFRLAHVILLFMKREKVMCYFIE